MKREGVLSWGDSFMALAKVIALRSKDPSTQVGACIVDKNKHVVDWVTMDYPMVTQMKMHHGHVKESLLM